MSLIRLLSLFEYILEDSGSAENKEILLFSHDKLSLKTKKYYYFHMTSFHWRKLVM